MGLILLGAGYHDERAHLRFVRRLLPLKYPGPMKYHNLEGDGHAVGIAGRGDYEKLATGVTPKNTGLIWRIPAGPPSTIRCAQMGGLGQGGDDFLAHFYVYPGYYKLLRLHRHEFALCH
jgi:hypothetical protein